MERKKGYFILYKYSSGDNHSGIGLKIRNQIKAFNDAGLICEEIVLPHLPNNLYSIIYGIPFLNVCPVWTYREEFDTADFLYMRRPEAMTPTMRKVLLEAKKRNPSIKIVIEIPTYPYDKEYEDRKYKKIKLGPLVLLWDRYNRTRMKGIVDYFAVLNNIDTVFGVPTLRISNGIDIQSIPERVPLENVSNEIHICAVALFVSWHGYERVIEGLRDYYHNGGSRQIMVHFVGEGNELSSYNDLISKYGLSDHFIFHGYLEGNELDAIYNRCTLALGSFGFYKIGVDLSCNLKSREAVARGIPSVTGCSTDIFTKGYSYYLEFPNDPSPIDIEKMVSFHDEIYREGQEKVIKAIRAYAYQTVSMESAMREVINYFRS